MKNKVFKKTVVAALSIAVIASTSSMIASAADGVTLTVDPLTTNAGLSVRGYYKSATGAYIEVKPVKSGNDYYFAGKQNSADYQLFYYEFFDSTGKSVSEKYIGYAGDVSYLKSTDKIPVKAKLTYEQQMLAMAEEAGLDTAGYKSQAEANSVSADENASETTVEISTTIPDIEPDTSNTQIFDTNKASYNLNVRIDTSCNMSLIKNAFKISISDGTNSKDFLYNTIKTSATVANVPAGTYVLRYAATPSVILTKADKSVTLNTSDVTAVVGLEPACSLTVVKTLDDQKIGAEFKIENIAYTTAHDNVFGIEPNVTYVVTDTTTGTAYNVKVPADIKNCSLDLGTGTLSLSRANETAVLEKTAEATNPYNIPKTVDKTEKTKAKYNIIAGIVGLFTALAGAVIKHKVKN